jgi:methionyl-tRNA formyltransferase
MKICIAGKNNIAVDICSFLLKEYNKEEICVLINKTDEGKNTFQRSLRLFAEQEDIKIMTLEDLYDINGLIFISLEYDRIIDPDKFNSKKLFNIHFSLLPSYKGVYTSALPILNSENYTGVTLHEIDKGIDTGDIISQRKININRSDSAKDLYLKFIYHGTRLCIDNLESLISGTYKTEKQKAEKSSYYSRNAINYKNLEINLNTTAYQIERQVKAFSFRNYQIPSIHGWKIVNSNILETKSYLKPGTIIENTKDKIIISSIDYDIELIKDQYDFILDYCSKDRVKELLEINIESFLEEKNDYGWTPLMVATYNNSKKVFNYLLTKGADINAINNNGTSVLMYAKDCAIKYNDSQLLNNLIYEGANVYHIDYYGHDIFYYLKNQSIELYNHIKNII